MNSRARYAVWLLVAAAAPVALAAALLPLRGHVAAANIALILVAAVALPAATGNRLAGVVAGVSAALSFDWAYVVPYGTLSVGSNSDLIGISVYIAVGLTVSEVARRSNARHRVAADQERSLRAEVERLAEQQGALRRVATLVALGAPHEQIFDAVSEEIGHSVPCDTVQIFRYDPDATIVRVAAWGQHAEELALHARFLTGGHNVPTMVLSSGRPARTEDAATITGPPASIARQLGYRSSAGSPIVVDGRLWGLVLVSSARPHAMTADTEQGLGDFTELVATAISNAQMRSDLAASRQRIVVAADEARRKIEPRSP